MAVVRETITTEITLNDINDTSAYLDQKYAERAGHGGIRIGARVRLASRTGVPAGMAFAEAGIMVLPAKDISAVLVVHETAGVMVTMIQTANLVPY